MPLSPHSRFHLSANPPPHPTRRLAAPSTITHAATDVTRSCNAPAHKAGGRGLRRTCTPSRHPPLCELGHDLQPIQFPIVGTLRHPSQGNRDYGPHTPRRLSQIPDHETRDLVDERS